MLKCVYCEQGDKINGLTDEVVADCGPNRCGKYRLSGSRLLVYDNNPQELERDKQDLQSRKDKNIQAIVVSTGVVPSQ